MAALKSKKYAEEILQYLKQTNRKIFRADWIAKYLGVTSQHVGVGIKYLKKKGKIEKIGCRVWMLKN